MLTSRNSAGEIELYTDIGQLIGVLPSDYPFIEGLEEFMDDGGPGSGNWGHRGRPGKRGGSGKGGGKAFRSGNSAAGYVSFTKKPQFEKLVNLARKHYSRGSYSPDAGKREFWRAVRMDPSLDNALKEQHQTVSPKESYSDYVDRMFEMLSDRVEDEKTHPDMKKIASELDENERIAWSAALQKNGLNPAKIVNNPAYFGDKEKFLEILGNHTGWGKHLVDRNFRRLSDQEKADMNKLLDRHPWSDEPDQALIPDEKALLSEEPPEVAEYYMALKAKAIGIGGVYIPDRPKEVDMPPESPKAKGPDYSWYEEANGGHGGIGFEGYMATAVGESYSYASKMTKQEFIDLNQRFVDKMKYGNPSPKELSYYATRAISGMRKALSPIERQKYGSIYGTFTPTPEMLSRLDDSEKKTLLDICNGFASSGFSPIEEFSDLSRMTGDDFFQVEKRMRNITPKSNVQKQPFKDYALLMEKMLTGAVPSAEDPAAKAAAEKKEQQTKAAAERAEKYKAEQEAFRNSDGAKAKRNAQDKIRNLDLTALRSMDKSGIAVAMNETGIFHGDKKFNVSDRISEETYVEAASAYQRVLAKFPFLAGDMGGFGDDYPSSHANAGTYSDPFKHNSEIVINYRQFENRERYQKTRDSEVASKFKVPVDVPAQEATMTHELGHSLANWMHRVAYGPFMEKEKKRGYYTEVSDVNQVTDEIQSATLKALKIRRTKENIKEQVSEYAFTNSHEFFAECFCELMCSRNPRPVAVEFGRQVEKFLKDHGITEETSGTVPTAMYKRISNDA